jgi:fucose permease
MRNKNKTITLIILAFSIMALFGFMENIRGTVIPEIKKDFNVNYSNIGFMIFIASAGYLIAPFIGGISIDKFGRKRVLGAGLLLIVASAIGIQFADSFGLLILLFTVMTSGFGLIEVGLNALGAQIFITKAAVMMSFLHLFYGAGASASPKYSGVLLSQNTPWRHIYLYSLLLVGILCLFLFICRFPADISTESEQKLPLRKIATDKKIWLFIAVLGFCQLAEHGVGNWLVNFLQVERGMDENESSLYLSLFFVAFTIGRIVGGYLAERLGYIKIVLYFTLFSLILFAGGLMAGSKGSILFSLMGFFISVKYPTVMTIIMKEFSRGVGSIMGFIITGAATVSMTFNWLIGRTNDNISVYIGFGSLLIYTSLIIIFLFPLSKMLTYNSQEHHKQGESLNS